MKSFLIFTLYWGLSQSLTWEETPGGPTWEEQYRMWAADLEPGHRIVVEEGDGETCHCMVPDTSTESTTTTTEKTTSTTPTTTSTTSTTTSTTSTSTSTTSTTTVPVYDCNQTITVSTGSLDVWSTPNFPNGYPEDIVCVLTVTIPSTLPLGVATVTTASGTSMFLSAGDCQNSPDRLEVVDDPVGPVYYCGNQGSKEWTLLTNNDAPKSITLTFFSSSADGGTGNGILVTVRGINLGG